MEDHAGRADKAAAAAAPQKWRIQDPGYLHGYTWDEVVRDPLVLMLAALHLVAIGVIFRSMELSTENLGAFIMSFVLLAQCALWCMFALVGGPFSGSLHYPASSSSSGTSDGARRPPLGRTSDPSSAPGAAVRRLQQGTASCPCCGAGLSLSVTATGEKR